MGRFALQLITHYGIWVRVAVFGSLDSSLKALHHHAVDPSFENSALKRKRFIL
jgi:hypothetical protein